MKQLKSNAVILAILAVTLCMPSCKKSDSMTMNEKNIDYPAAFVVNGESSSLSVIRLSDNTLSDSIMLMGTGTNMIMWPHHISSYSNYLASVFREWT